MRFPARLAAVLLVAGACHRTVVVQSGGATVVSPAGAANSQRAWRSLSDASAGAATRPMRFPPAWSFADGMLSKTRPVADIVSKDEFGNFELEFEWKIGEAGNSGIFYRGTEEYDHIYWSAPEYQLLDNVKADDNKTPLTSAGADYGLYPPPDGHREAGRRVERDADRRRTATTSSTG